MGAYESKPKPDERKWARTLQLEWSAQETAHFVSEVRRITSGKKIKVLVFGPTGAGKSALCNGFKTVLDGSRLVSTYFPCGQSAGTFTRQFKPFTSDNISVIDMNGLIDTDRITDNSIEDIISGKVPFYKKLTDWLEVKDTDDARVLQSDENAVSCVVLVLPIAWEISHDLQRMINCLKKLTGEGVTSCRVILTHLDVYDSQFQKPVKLRELFDTPTVQTAVMAKSEKIGIPPRYISVVRNYHDQEMADEYTNHLLAFVFYQIASTAQEHVHGKAVEKEFQNQ